MSTDFSFLCVQVVCCHSFCNIHQKGLDRWNLRRHLWLHMPELHIRKLLLPVRMVWIYHRSLLYRMPIWFWHMRIWRLFEQGCHLEQGCYFHEGYYFHEVLYQHEGCYEHQSRLYEHQARYSLIHRQGLDRWNMWWDCWLYL